MAFLISASAHVGKLTSSIHDDDDDEEFFHLLVLEYHITLTTMA